MNNILYRMYSVNSEFSVNENSNKIYSDIEQMAKIKEFDEIIDFIELNYGKLNDLIVKDYNEIKLVIGKIENIVEICALKGSKLIMGRRWKFVSKDKKKTE